MRLRLIALWLFCLGCVLAADTPPDPAARAAAVRKIADGITYHEGEAVLGDGLAKVSVPAQFRYLTGKDTDTILTELWGNPKSDGTLGAVVPVGFDPLQAGGWLVIITYEEEGFVKDTDANTIDYTKLLADMKEQVSEASKEREKDGYHSIQLIGWAQPPRYDAAAHKLYWAKELKFGSDDENTLNYNIRMLGRRGVLVLNAVASMSQLGEVEKASPALLAMVDFQEGHRYADFNASTDKVATFGLAALVAGGIAAKAGLLKGLWIGILALKKFIIIGLIALASYAKRIWAWIRGRPAEETASAPPASPPPAGTA